MTSHTTDQTTHPQGPDHRAAAIAAYEARNTPEAIAARKRAIDLELAAAAADRHWTPAHEDRLQGAMGRVEDQRRANHERWGTQPDLSWSDWLAVLTEEVGETAEAVLVLRRTTAERPRARTAALDRLRAELIDTAAVAAAMIERVTAELDAID